MNPAFHSSLRHILTILGGYAIGRGWIESAALEPIIGALLVLTSVAWSVYASRKDPK